MQAYASKIGADLNIISERKFPDWPLAYEKHQVFEAGKDYDWNIYLDIDVLVHPDIDDVTTWHPEDRVGNWWFRDIRDLFNVAHHPVFTNDGRFYGLVDCLVVTSRTTHNLWKPLSGSFSEYRPLFYDPNYWTIGIYSLSHNLAANRFPISGVLRNNAHMVLLEHSREQGAPLEEIARSRLKEWGIVPAAPVSPTPSLPSFVFMNVPFGASLAAKLQRDLGLDVAVMEGSMSDVARNYDTLSQNHYPIIGIPSRTPYDDEHKRTISALLEKASRLHRGTSLISSFRLNERGAPCTATAQWNITLMELAARYDTSFLDLDIFIGQKGTRHVFTDGHALSQKGLDALADFFIKSAQHKSFTRESAA